MEKKNNFIDILLIFGIIICLCGIYVSRKNSETKNFSINNIIPAPAPKPAKYYIDLAKEAFDEKDYETAIKYWKQSLDAHPYHPEGVYHDIGMSYVLLHRYSEAIEPLKKSLEMEPNYSTTYYYLGKSYYYLNQIETARDYYEKSIEIKDKNGNTKHIPYAYKGLAKIERKKGNTEKAKEYELLSEKF